MKKERPILFSTPMVRALLDNRKTVTRRIMKPQPIATWMEENHPVKDPAHWEYEWPIPGDKHGTWAWADGDNVDHWEKLCPYGKRGELLFVRESWNWVDGLLGTGWYIFKASEEKSEECKWKPSIHMPKEATRIYLELSGIKVERISEISEAECIAEGVQSLKWETGTIMYKDYMADASGYGHPDHDFPTVPTAYQSYRSLWQKINGTPSPIIEKVNGKKEVTSYIVFPFDDEAAKEFAGKKTYRRKPIKVVVNPWVWCLTFKTISTEGHPDEPYNIHGNPNK